MDPFGLTIFCDDIRHEFDGKISLIGCFPASTLLLGEFPTTIAKLGLSVHFVFPRAQKIREFEVRIYLPEDRGDVPSITDKLDLPSEGLDLSQSQLPSIDTDVVPVTRITRNIILSPVQFKSEGLIRVRVVFNGTHVKAGTLGITHVPTSITPGKPPALPQSVFNRPSREA
jgi:hypothetical protein